jgi:acetylornithine deacetylase/succinyl-diaminopimelate desuccinylase-like protein
METAQEAIGQPVIQVPILGGSLPLYHFREVLGVPLITVPIVNHDNNQHGENENLRIQNLWDGIELIGGIMARLGIVWRMAT